MEYEVLILRRAQKQLSNVPKSNYARIRDSIVALASNARAVGSKKLTGRDGWRLRSENYRVIYEIDDLNAVGSCSMWATEKVFTPRTPRYTNALPHNEALLGRIL